MPFQTCARNTSPKRCMLSGIPDTAQSGLTYVRSEFYQDEPDNRPQAKSGTRVVRGYYLLEEFSPPTSGEARLLRRFWFDRLAAIRLARLQSFDNQGLLDYGCCFLG